MFVKTWLIQQSDRFQGDQIWILTPHCREIPRDEVDVCVFDSTFRFYVTKILLFQVNFIREQQSFFFMISAAGIALKLEKVNLTFAIFNPSHPCRPQLCRNRGQETVSIIVKIYILIIILDRCFQNQLMQRHILAFQKIANRTKQRDKVLRQQAKEKILPLNNPELVINSTVL